MLRKNCLLVVALLGVALVLSAEESLGDHEVEQQVEEGPKECVGSGGQDAEAAELSIESGINSTKHWLTKVRLQHAVSGTTSENRRQTPVQLQLRRWAGREPRRDGSHLVTLQATLTGPLISSDEDLPWDDSNKSHSKPRSSLPEPTSVSGHPSTSCPTCSITLSSSPPESNASSYQLPPCPICSSAHSCPPPQSCQPPPPCSACPTCVSPPLPPPEKCPSPCAACPVCSGCSSSRRPTAYGYKSVPGSNSTYRLHLAPLDWYAAQATCEREGGHLAILKTKGEYNGIKTLFNNPIYYNLHYVLIGINDILTEGTWYTVLDEPFDSIPYRNWARGEPNNMRDQDCGSLRAKEMSLDDHFCNIKLPYLCERSEY